MQHSATSPHCLCDSGHRPAQTLWEGTWGSKRQGLSGVTFGVSLLPQQKGETYI